MVFKVPSNPNNSMILWFYVCLIKQHQEHPDVATQERSQITAPVCIYLIKSSNPASCPFPLVKMLHFIKYTVEPQSAPAVCAQLKPCVFNCCVWPPPASISPVHNTAGISYKTLIFLTRSQSLACYLPAHQLHSWQSHSITSSILL